MTMTRVGTGILAAVSVSASLYQGGLAILSFLTGEKRFLRKPIVSRPSVLVLIPAHNEEAVIPHCLEAVGEFDRGGWRPRVVVIADNCDDNTARVARDLGVETIVREDRDHRGKGEALAWALARPDLLDGVDAVLLLDADDRPEPETLDVALEEKARSGVDIVQVAHVSRGANTTDESALDLWATTLINRVRPRGLAFLGLPTRLQGGGMLFDAEVFRDLGWPSGGVSEDFFATLRVLDKGYQIGFTDTAIVWALSTETVQARRAQRVRWESGRLLGLAEIPGLLYSAFTRRSGGHAVMAAHLLVAPMTVHVASLALGLIVGWRRPRLRAVLLCSAAATGLYLAEGLRLIGQPELSRKAVAAGPRFLVWKLRVQGEALKRFRAAEWEYEG